MPSRWSRDRTGGANEATTMRCRAPARRRWVDAMSRLIRALALLGGTFDPIHYGHLRLAAEVKAALGLPEVRLIPAGIPPHRMAPVASAAHRLAMAALGCAEFTG